VKKLCFGAAHKRVVQAAEARGWCDGPHLPYPPRKSGPNCPSPLKDFNACCAVVAAVHDEGCTSCADLGPEPTADDPVGGVIWVLLREAVCKRPSHTTYVRKMLTRVRAELQKRGATPTTEAEPLTKRAEVVYQEIVTRGPLTGRRITDRTGIDQSTLTSRIIPELKRLRRIKNKPGAGYYSPDHYRP